LKDLTDFHAKESQVAVGEGILTGARDVCELIAINYKGFVDLEYEIMPTILCPASSAALPICAACWQAWGYVNHG